MDTHKQQRDDLLNEILDMTESYMAHREALHGALKKGRFQLGRARYSQSPRSVINKDIIMSQEVITALVGVTQFWF